MAVLQGLQPIKFTLTTGDSDNENTLSIYNDSHCGSLDSLSSVGSIASVVSGRSAASVCREKPLLRMPPHGGRKDKIKEVSIVVIDKRKHTTQDNGRQRRHVAKHGPYLLESDKKKLLPDRPLSGTRLKGQQQSNSHGQTVTAPYLLLTPSNSRAPSANRVSKFETQVLPFITMSGERPESLCSGRSGRSGRGDLVAPGDRSRRGSGAGLLGLAQSRELSASAVSLINRIKQYEQEETEKVGYCTNEEHGKGLMLLLIGCIITNFCMDRHFFSFLLALKTVQDEYPLLISFGTPTSVLLLL